MTPLTVAWISDFPLEWLPEVPEPLRHSPRRHPAMWEFVLLGELEKNPAVRLHIFALRSGMERSFVFERNNVTFHVLKYRGGTRASTFYWMDTWLLKRELQRIKPDLVHAWGNEKGAGLVAARCPFPFLITVQGLFTWYRQHIPMAFHDKISVWAEQVSLSKARHATVESKFSVHFVGRKWPRLKVHQVEHAPNWLFHRIERQPECDPIRFATTGTICLRKGSDLLLMALDELIDELPFRLVVMGDPDESFLEPWRRKLSPALWQRVEFKGHLQPAAVVEELRVATMLLFPTRVDNSPNAVKEAVVAGVPVVASDVGGIPDYVMPGQNGLLFKSGDLGEFVKAIRQACQHPLFRRGRVEPESLAASRSYLSPKRMSERFLEAYAAVLGMG